MKHMILVVRPNSTNRRHQTPANLHLLAFYDMLEEALWLFFPPEHCPELGKHTMVITLQCLIHLEL